MTITDEQVDMAMKVWRDGQGFSRDRMRRVLEQFAASAPVAPQGEWVMVPKTALLWLFGEGPDDNGVWFGDLTNDMKPKGAFWWRTIFRAMLAAAPSASVEDAVKAEHINRDRLESLRGEYGKYRRSNRLASVHGTATLGEFLDLIDTALSALRARKP